MKKERSRPRSRGERAAIGVAALLLFVFALEMMKSGAGALTPVLRGHLAIDNAADSLGLGWLIAYLVLSGSPAAAIAMALLSGDLLTPLQTYTMVTGSRLGASLIVLLIGFMYALRGQERWTVMSTGVLSLLLTASVQIPGIFVGSFLLRQGWLEAVEWSWLEPLSVGINGILEPLMNPVAALLPQWALFIAGGVLVTASLQLFDKALPQLRFQRAGLDRPARLIYRPVVMFLLGFAVTLLTLSVSVSIGILVPLSARGYVRRENIMPYVLGANISTMIDTLAAAVLLSSSAGVRVVIVHMVSAVIVSLPLVLLAYEPYERVMSRALDWTMRSRRNFAVFLGVFFLIPIVLVVL